MRKTNYVMITKDKEVVASHDRLRSEEIRYISERNTK